MTHNIELTRRATEFEDKLEELANEPFYLCSVKPVSSDAADIKDKWNGYKAIRETMKDGKILTGFYKDEEPMHFVIQVHLGSAYYTIH
jgi:hypothetical protein